MALRTATRPPRAPGWQGPRFRLQRTFRCRAARAFDAFVDGKAMRWWAGAEGNVDPREGGRFRIGEDEGLIEVCEPPRRLFVGWLEGSAFPGARLEVTFVARGRDRVTVKIEQGPFRTARERDAAQEAWREALQRLQSSVEPRPYDPRLPAKAHTPRRPTVPNRHSQRAFMPRWPQATRAPDG